jgi:predicted MFS family arabinose efflux permease
MEAAMNMANSPEGTLRAALRYPAFRSLLTGLAVSQVGDWLYNLALVTVVYTRTGSVLWAGIATGARVVPMVVLGPVGGVIADRFDRRRVMVASDLLRLALMLGLAVVVAARLPVVLAPVIAALATTAGTPYLACVAATTPRLVRDGDLPGANAARSAVSSIGIIVGPAIGGVLLLLGPPAIAFAVNAVTFGAAAACVLAIRAPGAFTVPARPGASSRPGVGGQVTSVLGSVFTGITDGAAALRAHPAAIRLVGADLICSVVYGMQTVVLVLVADQAGLGMHGYGYLFAAVGVGALVGISLAGRALRLPFRPGLALAMSLVGLSMLALPAARWGSLALVLAAVSGAGAILVEIMTETGLQRMLPEEVFGRAYGLALPASVAGIVVGSLIAPVLVSVIGLTGALVACGGVATAYGLQLIAGRRPAPAHAAAHAASHPLSSAPPATPADLAPTAPWPTAVPHPSASPGRAAGPRPTAVSHPTASSWPSGTARPTVSVALDPALAPTAPWPTIVSRPAATSKTAPPR